jgi:glycogen operon protein
MRHPHVLQLIMDSLRYWHVEMHVDGFRFDLAATLARELHDVDRLSAFFDIIQQDPYISQVKLIAEPWDVGEGGYQVGNFPSLWSEWNGKYRDAIRDYWRGTERTLDDLATRLTGSPRTTASRCAISSRTTPGTTRRTERTTATEPTTTAPGTAARRDRPRIRE